MMLFNPNPKLRWLFCMTHPDDEISLGAWIRRLTHAGADVHISWTHGNPEREYEARQAAKFLGVSQASLHFHQGPDRVLCDRMAEILPGFQRMMDTAKPDRVVAGAFEQGHLDHDATNFLVHQTFRGVVLETPFYHAYCNLIPVMNRFAQTDGEELLALTDEERTFKVELARQYPSQAIFGNLVWFRLWERLTGAAETMGEFERLRVQTHLDFRTPNLPPKLRKRVLRTGRWQRWLEALDQFEAIQDQGSTRYRPAECA